MDAPVKPAHDDFDVNSSLILFAKMAGSITAMGRSSADGVVKSAGFPNFCVASCVT
jgi:hypothetical protein